MTFQDVEYDFPGQSMHELARLGSASSCLSSSTPLCPRTANSLQVNNAFNWIQTLLKESSIFWGNIETQTEDWNWKTEHLSIRERVEKLEVELMKKEAEVRLQMVEISRVDARQLRLKGDIVRLKGAESRERTFKVTGTWPP